MEGDIYNCSKCVNKHSPLCELCYKIDSPSGNSTKPTYFVSAAEIVVLAHKNIKAKIVDNIGRNNPIPINWVIEYNKSVEK